MSWDQQLPPDCADRQGKRLLNAPTWCEDSWCYVDPSNCSGVNIASSFYFETDPILQYSYETCGAKDLFAPFATSASKPATELVDIIEKYSKQLRTEVESAYALTMEEESVTECTHWFSSCPCDTCEMSQAWTQQLLPSSGVKEMKMDFGKTTLTLAEVYNDGSRAVKRAECMTQVIASKYKSIVRREYNDENRIAYMYFGDQGTGGLIEWPALVWCTESYDARLRPWYATGAAGPKDLVILLDMSGSMTESGLRDPAIMAAKAVLKTLTRNDYSTVVLYNSRSTVFDGINMMHQMTPENIALMVSWLDDQHAIGGTDFRIGFRHVAKVFEESNKAGTTSGCVQTVLFLTDGKDTSGFLPSEIKNEGSLEGVVILTYSFGDDADDRLPKQIACQNNGIWYPVKSQDQIEDTMAKYYALFAAGIDSDTVRWVEYADAITGTQLISGCLPAYDRSQSVPVLIGVSCIDINVIVSLDTLKTKPTYHQMREKMKEVTTKCPTIHYPQNTLQQLRSAVSEKSVCKACDLTDEGCQDEPHKNGPSNTTSDGAGQTVVTAAALPKAAPALAWALVVLVIVRSV